MKMFIAGQWRDRDERIEVRHPFNGELVDTVPKATSDDVEDALAMAVEGAEIMRRMPGYERYQILHKAAGIMTSRLEELGQLISREEGMLLAEGRGEAARAQTTMEVSAEEAKRLYGEVLPLDGAPNGDGRLGFTLRVPCGIVLAITPFNFPMNLVCHKVGPALAGGNAVILKPASDTPLSALTIVEILLEAGLPAPAISCLTGGGGEVGSALASDHRVRKITFTGSYDVGRKICEMAGVKKVTMELGSNSPLIVMDDADVDKAVEATMACGYSNAGQVCISAQRVIATPGIRNQLVDALAARVNEHTAGDPFAPATRMGPMIREKDAQRVNEWIQEAVTEGAKLVSGGKREGHLHEATLLSEVSPGSRLVRDELFGPAVAVMGCKDIDEAIHMANDTNYGLSAGIFTQDIDRAIRYAREVHSGNLHINWGPQWRADLMPYGGLKDSGFGKEGPKYAMEEMTETKSVVIHVK